MRRCSSPGAARGDASRCGTARLHRCSTVSARWSAGPPRTRTSLPVGAMKKRASIERWTVQTAAPTPSANTSATVRSIGEKARRARRLDEVRALRVAHRSCRQPIPAPRHGRAPCSAVPTPCQPDVYPPGLSFTVPDWVAYLIHGAAAVVATAIVMARRRGRSGGRCRRWRSRRRLASRARCWR